MIERRAPASYQPTYPNPSETSELRRALEEANAGIEAREAAEFAERINFKNASNEKGELQHPYFEEVEPAMIAFARSYAASGQTAPSRSELYETAVWANPSTRAALLASQKQAEQAKAAEDARIKAARSPRSRPRDKELAKVLEKHGLRDDRQGKTTAEIVQLIPTKNGTAAELEAIRKRVVRYYMRKSGEA